MAQDSFQRVLLTWIVIAACLHLSSGQQVYLSLGTGQGSIITSNNTEILINDIGEDISGGLPSLTCHTDLTACCRNIDTVDGVAAGEWYYPDGSMVMRNADARAAGDPFYRVRNAAQVARLNRRISLNPLSPTGSYCCVIPTTGGEMTFCANIIVVCPSLALTNGIIYYSDPTLGVGTLAIYSCNTGYILTSSGTRVCGSNGGWSGSAGFCGVLCPSLPSLINGVISYSQQEYTSGIYLQNTRATYYCNQGYILIGESSSTCQSNRTWSPPIPSCRALCPSLPRLSNGVTSYSQEPRSGSYIEDTVVMYTCNQGYTLIGESSRVCQSDRTWSSSEPVCRALCPSLSTLANGPITYSQEEQDSVYIEDTVAMFSCNQGYILLGNKSSTCLLDRTWSSPLPACQAGCRFLFPLPNGAISYNQESRNGSYLKGTAATYSCSKGYILIGSDSSTCQTDRTWQPSPPYCRATCPSLSTINNGNILYSQEAENGTYQEETIAMYSCKEGYTLIGDNSSTCQSDRIWSSSGLFCRDDAIIQLKFGPTNHCIQWSEQKVAAVRESLRQAIHEVITSGSEAIPLVNIKAGVFSCRTSQTTTTYRTTIFGTRDASAVKAAANIQRRVESGFVAMVEWYLVDIISSCPVHIDSLLQDECIEDQCVEGCVAVCKARG